MPLASRDVAGAKGWGWGLPSSGLLAALVGLSLLLLVRSSLPASGWGVALQAGRTGAATTALTAATGGAACTGRPTLMGYVPSNWEERWRVAATPELVAAPGSICGLVAAQPALVETWLTGVKLQSAALLGDSQRAAGGARRLGAEWVQPPPHDLYPPTTFSRFLYRDDCGATIAAPIEPLVGHFRHPLGPSCLPKNHTVDIESRDYLLLSGLTSAQFARVFPGRKYLVDFGTNGYRTSLAWFLERYSAQGVVFDEVWAWEAAPVSPAEYWASMPADVMECLHFYNRPLEMADIPELTAFLKGLVRPGDFLVVKVDIDRTPWELAFMEAVRRDSGLRRAIGECFFEAHYIHPDMPWPVRSNAKETYTNTSYAATLELFGALRAQGLRLHYWP